MADSGSSIIGNTIESIFSNNNKLLDKQSTKLKKKGNKGPDRKELELALAVLLVDLAGCDQNFEPQEYNVIINGLRRIFGTSKAEVAALVQQANLVLANLRGTKKFGDLLSTNLGEEEKKAVMEIIEEVIQADGKEDGFETYLRHKLAGILGIKVS